MKCLPAIALLLLAFSAGVWILYKVKSENLGTFFKAAGWFVIVMAIGSMLCCSVHCMFRRCGYAMECGPGECGPGGMEKKVMIWKGGHGGCESGMEACGHGKSGCGMDKEGCCKDEPAGGHAGCGDGHGDKHHEHKADSVEVKVEVR